MDQPVDTAPALPFRPDNRGFRWHVDPEFDVPSLLVAIGRAMQQTFTPEENASFGPKILISVDLRTGSGHFAIENMPEQSQ